MSKNKKVTTDDVLQELDNLQSAWHKFQQTVQDYIRDSVELVPGNILVRRKNYPTDVNGLPLVRRKYQYHTSGSKAKDVAQPPLPKDIYVPEPYRSMGGEVTPLDPRSHGRLAKKKWLALLNKLGVTEGIKQHGKTKLIIMQDDNGAKVALPVPYLQPNPLAVKLYSDWYEHSGEGSTLVDYIRWVINLHPKVKALSKDKYPPLEYTATVRRYLSSDSILKEPTSAWYVVFVISILAYSAISGRTLRDVADILAEETQNTV